jgi:hypothetical protein
MESKADKTILQREEMGKPIPPENQPVVYEAIKLAVEKDSPHLDEQAKQAEIGSEMFDHICMFSGYDKDEPITNTLCCSHVAASREVLGM